MDLAVKQRILGGVVLVAGAVLFLPLLLEGAGVRALQPPAAPVAPKVPDTAALAPAITHEAAALEADISASHGEPTFYPVQPPTVTVPAPEPAVEQQFRMVTPSAAPAPATAPAAAVEQAAPVVPAKPAVVEPAAAAASTARPDAAASAAAAKAKADADARAKAEAAAKARAEADAKAAQARMSADALAKAKADAAAKAKAKAEAEARAKAEAAAKAKAAASKPAVAEADPAAAQAWVVQVASLSSKAKADELVATLRAKGYRAGIGGQEGAWRVSIGPELDRAVAESVKSRVAADPALKLSGWIQAYRP